MVKKLVASSIFILFAAPAFSQATYDWCADQDSLDGDLRDKLLGQALGDAGYEYEPSPLDDAADDLDVLTPKEIKVLFALEMLVKSERLSRSGATVVKAVKSIDGTPLPVEEYYELVPLPGMQCDGSPVSALQAMSPEKVARIRGETLAPSDVMAVGMQAYGESLLVTGGMLEKVAEESAFGPIFRGLVGSHSDESRMSDILTASSSPEACWDTLDRLNREAAAHVNASGLLPQGTKIEEPIKPWESVNPLHFMMGPACFAIAMADRLGEDLPEAAADLMAAQEAAFEGAQTHAPVVEELDGKTAFRIDIDGLNLTQSTASLHRQPSRYVQHASAGNAANPGHYQFVGRSPTLAQLIPPGHLRPVPVPNIQPADTAGQDFAGYLPMNTLQASVASSTTSGAGTMTIHRMSLWIDARKIVKLKTRMEGVMRQDGQSRDIFLENELKDYRDVPGTSLYEPYREILRVGGVMDPAQQAEMQEAVKRLDEYDKQMASMPPSQRAMMEKMMGPQMAQMRSMANGGAVEFEFITTSIEINPDLTAPATMSTTMAPNVVQIVQRHLVTLGYDPGNTDGELTKQTVVAISQYQAANGMEVTGQATPQLAGILSAAVDAMN